MSQDASQIFPTLEQDARRVYDVLRSGGVALIPTNVSYGLVAMEDDAVRRIYELKGRPSSKPCVTVTDAEIYDDVASPLDPIVRSWLDDIVTQTPLAVISRLNANSRLLAALSPYVFSQVTQDGTIATFFSAGELVQRVGELALADGRLVVGSSGNVSGAGNNSTFDAVPASIREGVDLALDWGPVRYANDQRLSTTILNLLTATFLRQGVNYAQIEQAWLAHTHRLAASAHTLPPEA
jgi:tRNA A37 threonylcarbamoyladenosine synthetase subunit TsaC/SUA5/YrdC